MREMYFVARNLDGKLYKFPYWYGMTATDEPHRHISRYPFDGNFYRQGDEMTEFEYMTSADIAHYLKMNDCEVLR